MFLSALFEQLEYKKMKRVNQDKRKRKLAFLCAVLCISAGILLILLFAYTHSKQNDPADPMETKGETHPDSTMQKKSEPDSGTGNGLAGKDENDSINESDDINKSDDADQASRDENQMSETEQEIERILENMTLEEKLYQMFVITPEQLTGVETVVAAGETTKNCLMKYPVGGLVYFSDNLQTADQTRQMLKDTQEYARAFTGLSLFLCIDEEGGRVARVANHSSFHVPKYEPMSKITSESEAYQVGAGIGTYLADLGFNVDFAPDADVLTVSGNTVIGDRSFGSDPELVSRLAAAYSDGLHSQNICSTYKHFPGHGATVGDTHQGFAYTNKNYEELESCELLPFMQAQQKNVDFVMVAHISVPEILGDNTPCSLSYEMISGILRGKYGYEGIVITDAMNMGAITDTDTTGDSVIRAIKAGADMILMPEDFPSAYASLLNAVQNGTIKTEQIDESMRRILRLKLKM